MVRRKRPDRNGMKTRNLSFGEGLNDSKNNAVCEDNGKEPNPVLSDICNTKWKVFRVSPLFNFNSKKLKWYGKKLCQEIVSKERFGSNFTYECTFSLNDQLRLNIQNQEALQVEVTANQCRKVYRGYFICWSSEQLNTQDYVSLPILLVEGKLHEVRKVHSSICKMFDCDIQPVNFSFNMLITFFVKFLETPKKEFDVSHEFLSLEYKIPGCEIKDTLKLSLLLEDTIIVMAVTVDNLRERFSGITNMEIIFEFYSRILQHIHNVHKMNLNMAELNKIVFPDGIVTADGQLKMTSEDIAMSALTILQHFIPLSAVINT